MASSPGSKQHPVAQHVYLLGHVQSGCHHSSTAQYAVSVNTVNTYSSCQVDYMGLDTLLALYTLVKASDSAALPACSFQVYLTVTDTQGVSSDPAKATLKAPACSLPPVAKLPGGPYTMSCNGSKQLDGKHPLPASDHVLCACRASACYLPACLHPPPALVHRALVKTGALQHDTCSQTLQILYQVYQHSMAQAHCRSCTKCTSRAQHGTGTREPCSLQIFRPPDVRTVLCCVALLPLQALPLQIQMAMTIFRATPST